MDLQIKSCPLCVLRIQICAGADNVLDQLSMSMFYSPIEAVRSLTLQ